MEAYRLEMTLEEDGMLVLHNLPLTAGETVEVITLVQPRPSSSTDKYPLHGLPITYIDPTEPVALEDWEVLGDHS